MESIIARWQIQKWNVAFRKGYVVFDDRLLNAEVIRRLTRCPDQVVLGSSRCMQLRQEFFPGSYFVNHALRRAVLEDVICLWQLYRRRGWSPKRILIGVDAWLLDAAYWKEYWLELRAAFGEIQEEWRLPYPTKPDRWERDYIAKRRAELGTANHWKRIVASLLPGMKLFFFKTRADSLVQYVRRIDGSVSYHREFRERAPAQVIETIQKSVRFPTHPISENMKCLLEQFMGKLGSEGVEVSLIIPPYHPAFCRLNGKNIHGNVIEGYDDFRSGLNELEYSVRKLAEKNRIRVYGSFDPSKAGAGENEFFDWMHAKELVFKRMLEK